MKYRFLLPSREAALHTLSFSNEPADAMQMRSLPKGISILLVFPSVVMLLLSSLAVFNRSDLMPGSVPRVRLESSQGKGIDYATLYKHVEALVDRGEFSLALQLLPNIAETSAKREQISAEMLRQAQNSYPNELEGAVRLVASIPANTASYAEAQRLTAEWTQQLTWMRTAEYAANEQQWDSAAHYLDELKSTHLSRTDWFRRIEQRVKQRDQSAPSMDEMSAHYNLANVYEQSEQYQLAEYHYRESARFGSPVRDRAINNLARIYILQNQPGTATLLLGQALDQVRQPNIQAAFYKNLGWAAYEQQNFTDALKWLQTSTEFDPTRADAYCLLAKTRGHLNQDALSDRTSCLMLQSTEDQPEVQRWRESLR
ncbi:hypothetical protein ACQ4M3_13410 [Leptolyngbya sp. AN03gr2]|uniref:hypothetical protein n=1 Tax=unclassified Leptolyngbya TaxID=2650499 RepID=UPI003D322DBF